MPSKESQINMYDVTLSKECWPNGDTLALYIHSIAKKWCFQLEAGSETGHLHWQIRMSLMKKCRPAAAVKAYREKLLNDAPDRQCRIVPSKTATFLASCDDEKHGTANNKGFDYVMKEDTRVEGPWLDTEFVVPQAMTRQLKEFMEMKMRPFQVKLEKFCKVIDNRYIIYIIEETGGTGKSITAEYLGYHKIARRIPAMKTAEDIMQMIMCLPPSPTYLIDMPRAMKKDNLWELYAGIEELKNGYAYDKRYGFRDRQMDRPQVIVFSNQFPELTAMSMDRWKIYRIVANDNPDLVDLEQLDPQDYVVEDAVNKALLNATLDQDKVKRKRITSELDDFMRTNDVSGMTRSDLVRAVKQRCDERETVHNEETEYAYTIIDGNL